MKYLLIGLIKLYRITLSRLKPPCCRFYPTCSVYGINAIRRFGSFKGGYLTVKRIARCNPFSRGGYDPVPEEFSFFRQTDKNNSV
ncbi:MAG: membrane protein insertion efficiency factor YidD [Ruminiclostridium sp.]|nr:membrane protein insertion efficiency factor YidD [Ruminiclostridium sp.]